MIPVPQVDALVEQEGDYVVHEVGLRCFCFNDSGQPDPTCNEHQNGGWLYCESETIQGLVTGISQNRELVEAGILIPGDCVFSPLSDAVVTEGDKITFTWPLPYGQGDPLVRSNENKEDTYYKPVRAIYCIDENKAKYREGIDFRFVDKTIQWLWDGKPLEGIAPAGGIRYTVKYMAFLEWIAYVPPVERINNGNNLGSKVILRKRHLVT